MATQYNNLVTKIIDWSNRDQEVFGLDSSTTLYTADNTVRIADFINYASDKAYRVLRVPPMEKTIRYTFTSIPDETGIETQTNILNNCLSVPADLIEFIHIRVVDAYGTGNSIVLNNKADTRTFHDYYSEKYDINYTWTRQGNQILLPSNPGVIEGREYEIFYYGRLGRPGATYDVSYTNFLLDVVTVAGARNSATPLTETAFDAAVVAAAADSTNTAIAVLGIEAQNWLMHENERILLFGALAEAFTYLGEEDMMAKYTSLFGDELSTLNREEEIRHASGGNIQINFNGTGLI